MSYGRVTPEMRDVLYWLPVRPQIIFKLCYIVRSCVVGVAPVYLQKLCVPVSEVAQCHWLRSSTYGDLCVPRVTIDRRYGRRAFVVSGPQLWNQLPAATRATCTDTPDCFKRALKASLFPWVVGVMLQITEPLRNFLMGGFSKVYRINISVIVCVESKGDGAGIISWERHSGTDTVC